MIDWASVFFNGLWILGASILLAALSYHRWLASLENRTLREQFNQASFLKFFWLSFILVSIGLAGTSRRPWETGLWIIFALVGLVNAIGVQRSNKQE